MTSVIEIKRARIAVTLSFLLNGIIVGTFVSRIPDFKETLNLTNSRLGLSLLIAAFGVLSALGPVGKLTAKYGSSFIVRIANLVLCTMPIFVSLLFNEIWFAISLFVYGATLASQDVSMNTHGVTLEDRSGRRFMGRFHAFWSVGGLVGTAIGGLLAQAGLGVKQHFFLIAILMFITSVVIAPMFLTPDSDKHVYTDESKLKKKRPQLILILGLLGMAASIGEGAAGDWGGVLTRETFGASPFVSSLPYMAFSFTMVIGRFFGDQLATKFGPNRILKLGGLFGGVGLALGLLAGGSVGVIIGWFLFGSAISAVIPLLFSAAGSMANKRFAGNISPAEAVAMISGISYFGFILGPPLMGFLADAITLRWAMLVPAALAIAISASSKIFTSD
jgi:MFS family permease